MSNGSFFFYSSKANKRSLLVILRSFTCTDSGLLFAIRYPSK